MKHLLVILILAAVASGCKKNTCIQCAKQVKSATQTTTVTTDYSIVYLQYCGRQADTAMSSNYSVASSFWSQYDIVPFSCAYTN